MATTTPNLALTLPTPDVDTGWGTTLNTDFTKIDDIFASGGTGTSVGVNVGSGKTMVMGGTLILGTGDGTNSAAEPTAIRGANRTGTNNAGPNLVIQAGNGTGTGGSGAIVFKTAPAGSSGSTANTLRNSFFMYNDGHSQAYRNTDGPIFSITGAVGGLSYGEYSSAGYFYNSTTPLNFGTLGNERLVFITNNAERMRLANTGAMGFAGENYGTSGQILTSNGSSTTPSWQDNRPLNTYSSQSVGSATQVTFSSIASSAEIIQIVFHKVKRGATNNILIRIGDSGGIEDSGYDSYSGISSSTSLDVTSTDGFVIYNNSATSEITGIVTLARMYGDLWDCSYTLADTANGTAIVGGGSKTLSATLDRVQVLRQGTGNFTSGNVRVMYLK